MSTQSQQFEAHKIRQNTKEAYDHLERGEIQHFNEEQISNLTRLKKGIGALLANLDALDPDLLSIDTINNLAAHLANVKNECAAFASNNKFRHIDSANSHFEQLLNSTRIQLAFSAASDSAASNAATSAHEKSLELVKKCTNSIAELKARIDEYHQATNSGKAHIQQLEKAIETNKARLDQAISDFQKQFSDQQAQRSSEFTNSQKEFSSKFSDALAGQSKKFDAHLDEIKSKSSEHQKFLEKRKAEVDEMFGAIGQGLRAGHFANTADAERKSANLFRWISLGLMSAMIVAAGFTYYYSLTHNEIDWKILLLRFATTIVVAIPAVYAAQESSKHREREKKLRKLHLELASIDAYLALLPIEKQHKLKEELTAKFFGQTEQDARDSDVSKHALFELIKGAVENLTKAKG